MPVHQYVCQKSHNPNSNTTHAIIIQVSHLSLPFLSFPLLLRNPNRLPRSSLNHHPASAPANNYQHQSLHLPPFLQIEITYFRNNLTIGLHVITPRCGTPSSGGLHEYCVISYNGQSLRSMAGPLRRFSWKFLFTMLT